MMHIAARLRLIAIHPQVPVALRSRTLMEVKLLLERVRAWKKEAQSPAGSPLDLLEQELLGPDKDESSPGKILHMSAAKSIHQGLGTMAAGLLALVLASRLL